jgi:hypothetical protein
MTQGTITQRTMIETVVSIASSPSLDMIDAEAIANQQWGKGQTREQSVNARSAHTMKTPRRDSALRHRLSRRHDD